MAKPRKQYYVGLKSTMGREVFTADTEPTEQSHGARFAAVIGPFQTKRGAEFMAQYGQGNPHLQTVYDAERIARAEALRVLALTRGKQ
jgi:hypothetical protein